MCGGWTTGSIPAQPTLLEINMKRETVEYICDDCEKVFDSKFANAVGIDDKHHLCMSCMRRRVKHSFAQWEPGAIKGCLDCGGMGRRDIWKFHNDCWVVTQCATCKGTGKLSFHDIA